MAMYIVSNLPELVFIRKEKRKHISRIIFLWRRVSQAGSRWRKAEAC